MRRLIAAVFVLAFVAGCQQILGDYTVKPGDDASTGSSADQACEAALENFSACEGRPGDCSGYDECQLDCIAVGSCADIQANLNGFYDNALGMCITDCEQ